MRTLPTSLPSSSCRSYFDASLAKQSERTKLHIRDPECCDESALLISPQHSGSHSTFSFGEKNGQSKHMWPFNPHERAQQPRTSASTCCTTRLSQDPRLYASFFITGKRSSHTSLHTQKKMPQRLGRELWHLLSQVTFSQSLDLDPALESSDHGQRKHHALALPRL